MEIVIYILVFVLCYLISGIIHQYYKAKNNEEQMKLLSQKMEDIKSKVSSIVVMDCKID